MVEALENQFEDCFPIIRPDGVAAFSHIEQGQAARMGKVEIVVARLTQDGEIRRQIIPAAFLKLLQEIIRPKNKLLKFQAVAEDRTKG